MRISFEGGWRMSPSCSIAEEGKTEEADGAGRNKAGKAGGGRPNAGTIEGGNAPGARFHPGGIEEEAGGIAVEGDGATPRHPNS